jgi:hypothetical protein
MRINVSNPQPLVNNNSKLTPDNEGRRQGWGDGEVTACALRGEMGRWGHSTKTPQPQNPNPPYT